MGCTNSREAEEAEHKLELRSNQPKRGTRKIRLVLLGDSGAGKTSMLTRFLTEQFLEGYHDPTIGAAYGEKSIATTDEVIKLACWDTAGQERYRCLTPFYTRDAQVCLLVFSVTDSGSFKEVPFWYEELRKHNRSCRVILVGNKSDLESERQVSYERAVQFTKDRLESCMYIETSCRDGSGVIEAFLQAAEIGSKQVNTPGGF